jgi:hypothetical protein
MTQRPGDLPLAWLPPVGGAGIVAVTLAGLVIPAFTAIDIGDGFIDIAIPVALGWVAVGEVMLHRFTVPRALRGEGSAAGVAPEIIERNMVMMSVMYPFADAVYGLALAVLLDRWLYAAIFGAVALLAFALLVPFTRSEVARSRRMRAGA